MMHDFSSPFFDLNKRKPFDSRPSFNSFHTLNDRPSFNSFHAINDRPSFDPFHTLNNRASFNSQPAPKIARNITHSKGDHVYGDIAPGVTLKIKGISDIVIQGTIGKGAKIYKDGIGNLEVNGTVEENVTFNMSSIGTLKFAHTPPESVIKRITTTGLGYFQLPGLGKETATASYFLWIGEAVDGIKSFFNKIDLSANFKRKPNAEESSDRFVERNTSWDDNRFNNHSHYISEKLKETTPKKLSPGILPKQIEPSAPVDEENISSDLNHYSGHLRSYLKSFEGKTALSTQIKNLKLSAEETKQFEKFEDAITSQYMDIPVSLHERYYDFETIKKMHEDPFTRESFNPLEVQSLRDLYQEALALIETIKSKRNETELASENQIENKFRPR